MDYIQVDIIGLSTSPSSGGAYALVLGEVGGNRRLPIIIGASEAQAIALELEKIQPPRPMTHDLLRGLFDALGAEVTDVVIDDLREGTFFAKIRYVYDDDEATLDARPSDAVALAVRTDAAIFVAASVLDEAGIPADDGDDDDEREAVAERESPDPARKTMSKLDRMESQLEKAIADEDYETAATLRDEIARMKGDN
ncbi:bifunctional nuclease family protein [Rubrivirga sp. S365]|uniref:Bifunctional nuclease family protein n=1 Tax=Rubrivirga litoralis TaxID=3075598 RepID=A0ABU3BVQ4_9BACT|nr:MULTISPECIES: bifunctional nuclease family protein [unclassified Rubrivirga]MDT0633231.1 bifunctional nuclease family protein [Rubrivirga sp. F394]MDT7855129.1 bifunctional nuclease family protein [Rubrivirga sp. S365]